MPLKFCFFGNENKKKRKEMIIKTKNTDGIKMKLNISENQKFK